MKKQKGQVIIEFALILPLFLILLFGIIYCGMLFYDYISLSNIARSAAREAAISQDFFGERNNIETYYTRKMTTLLTSLYTPYDDPTTHVKVKLTKIPEEEDDESGTENADAVKVKITMQRNAASPLMQMMLPENYQIIYFMRRDEQSGGTTEEDG